MCTCVLAHVALLQNRIHSKAKKYWFFGGVGQQHALQILRKDEAKKAVNYLSFDFCYKNYLVSSTLMTQSKVSFILFQTCVYDSIVFAQEPERCDSSWVSTIWRAPIIFSYNLMPLKNDHGPFKLASPINMSLLQCRPHVFLMWLALVACIVLLIMTMHRTRTSWAINLANTSSASSKIKNSNKNNFF